MQDCFLCRSYAEEDDRENLILKRGSHAFVIMNRYPYINGHLMIAPIRHVAALEALSVEEQTEIMALTTRAVAVLTEHMQPDGFNIGINLGRVAGAGLETHIHQHLVPRWSGDTNFMPVLGETRVIPQDLWELWDLLAKAFRGMQT